MVDGLSRPEDQELLALVRAGDNAAYEELYRAHLDGARHLARILVGNDQSEELVAESFARVLAALRSGNGPTDNFRSYLHVTIRNGYRDGLRAPAPAPVSDQPWLLDDARPDGRVEPPAEEMVDGLDETVAVDALSSLPESWQQVLWHVEVEGRKPAEVAELMDMRPGAVSSLAHRAREGLKRAYLDHHAGPVPVAEQCKWTHARMAQHARGDLGPRAAHKFGAHVDACPDCRAAFLAVDQVNRKLAAYVLPIVLLAAAGSGKGLIWLGVAGGAAAGGAAGGAASGGAGSGGATSGGPVVGVAVAAAAVVVAGIVGAAAWTLASGDDEKEEPVDVTQVDGEPPAAPDDAPPAQEPSRDKPKPKPDPVPVVEETPEPTAPTQPTEPPATEPPEPTDPPTTEPPEDVPVVPVAPTATPIEACGAYGSLTMADTKGVAYKLVSGGRRQGRWKVTASARDGYVIKKGARTSFTGDLGSYYGCVELVDVVAEDGLGIAPGGVPDWTLTADVEIPDGNPRQRLELLFVFDTPQYVHEPAAGEPWSCTTPGPDVRVTQVRCTLDYTGADLPDLTLGLDDGERPSPGLGNDPPRTGTVRLSADGAEVGSMTFEDERSGGPGGPPPRGPAVR